jgi:DNA-binding transcriptional ArsR family regulator
MLDESSPLVAKVVERLKAIADPCRVRILSRLQRGEATVNELADGLGIGQASVSKHLAILRRVGIVGVRKVGTQCFCSIRDPSIEQLCTIVCSGVQDFMAAEHAAVTTATKPARKPSSRSAS